MHNWKINNVTIEQVKDFKDVEVIFQILFNVKEPNAHLPKKAPFQLNLLAAKAIILSLQQ